MPKPWHQNDCSCAFQWYCELEIKIMGFSRYEFVGIVVYTESGLIGEQYGCCGVQWMWSRNDINGTKTDCHLEYRLLSCSHLKTVRWDITIPDDFTTLIARSWTHLIMLWIMVLKASCNLRVSTTRFSWHCIFILIAIPQAADFQTVDI